MTALKSADGESRDYVELVEASLLAADNPERVALEVFERVALSVAIANTDDHLRNWAFLRSGKGWCLSPLFDVNPSPYADSPRVTAIAGETGEREAQGLRDLAAYAGLDANAATAAVSRILAAASRWRQLARANGCAEREMKMFQPVFERKARELRRAFA